MHALISVLWDLGAARRRDPSPCPRGKPASPLDTPQELATIRHVTGNTTGLKQSHRRLLERTFLRRVDPDALISVELGRHLCAASAAVGRQVGVLIDRQGHVEHVFVGDAQRIYLPDVGRARAGLGNRRGLRHVHTVLSTPGLQRDDIADLEKLRLDAVVALKVEADGLPGELEYAYLHMSDARMAVRREPVRSLFALDVDFAALLQALQSEDGRRGAVARSGGRPTAALVGVYASRQEATARMLELRELAQTAGVAIDEEVVQLRRHVDHKYVLGRGKLEETVLRCLDRGCEILIVDHSLTPAQARAIAAISELKVIDRTQLILDIFAQHASTRDGKLQVELAQLKYALPRLTDLDAGLSRLTGGIGGRGPGETKLEINRRRARDRINRLERDIATVSQQRALRRSRRSRSQVPIVSIVGYTNAGKSTLMARLTQSKQLVADKLFATLDATSRRLRFPREREAVLTDTVGFIRELPPDLVRAFRATLEELEEADLLLHVVDASDPDMAHKVGCVVDILGELDLGTIPRLTVLNKADRLEPFIVRGLCERWDAVAVSAVQGDGLEQLVATIAHRLWQAEALDTADAWSPERGRPQLALVPPGDHHDGDEDEDDEGAEGAQAGGMGAGAGTDRAPHDADARTGDTDCGPEAEPV
jgi:GTP-binding protein HflX